MKIQMRHFWWFSNSQLVKHISYLEDVHPVMQKEDFEVCVVFHFYDTEWFFGGDFQFVAKAFIFSSLVAGGSYYGESFFICFADKLMILINTNCHIPVNKIGKDPIIDYGSKHDDLSIFCRTFWDKQKNKICFQKSHSAQNSLKVGNKMHLVKIEWR